MHSFQRKVTLSYYQVPGKKVSINGLDLARENKKHYVKLKPEGVTKSYYATSYEKVYLNY